MRRCDTERDRDRDSEMLRGEARQRSKDHFPAEKCTATKAANNLRHDEIDPSGGESDKNNWRRTEKGVEEEQRTGGSAHLGPYSVDDTPRGEISEEGADVIDVTFTSLQRIAMQRDGA